MSRDDPPVAFFEGYPPLPGETARDYSNRVKVEIMADLERAHRHGVLDRIVLAIGLLLMVVAILWLGMGFD